MNHRTLARPALALLLATTAAPALAQTASPPPPADSAQDRAAMNELLAADEYILRIQALDDNGPRINAVIDYDPAAPVKARQQFGTGPLRGRTVLVKDNVETAEWPTTAGSLALKDNATGRDAPLIALMRANGGVVLGKTNLSEWANIRSDSSTSGMERGRRVDAQSLRDRPQHLRIILWQRRSGRGGVRVGRHRDGDQRLDHLSGRDQRHRWLQAERRDRQPHPCRADFQHAGHRRADDPHSP